MSLAKLINMISSLGEICFKTWVFCWILNQTITWDKEVTIPMRDLNESIEDGFLLPENKIFCEAKHILDANKEPIIPDGIMAVAII